MLVSKVWGKTRWSEAAAGQRSAHMFQKPSEGNFSVCGSGQLGYKQFWRVNRSLWGDWLSKHQRSRGGSWWVGGALWTSQGTVLSWDDGKQLKEQKQGVTPMYLHLQKLLCMCRFWGEGEEGLGAWTLGFCRNPCWWWAQAMTMGMKRANLKDSEEVRVWDCWRVWCGWQVRRNSGKLPNLWTGCDWQR